jgi:hypothetical protein
MTEHSRLPTYHLNYLSPATVFEGQLFAVDPTRKLTGQLLSFPVDNLLEEELEKDRKASSTSVSMPTPSTTSSSSGNSPTSTEETETRVTEKNGGNGRRVEEFDDNIFDFVAAEEELDRQLQRQTELVAKIAETAETEEEIPLVSDDNDVEKDSSFASSEDADWRESRDEPFSWMEKLNAPALVPTVSIISIEATRKRTKEADEGPSKEEWLQRKTARRDEEEGEGEGKGDIAKTELGEGEKRQSTGESKEGQDKQVEELEEEEEEDEDEEEIADTTYFYKLDGAEALKPEPLAVDLLGNVICLYESQMVVLMPRNNKQREVLRHFWSPASSPIPVSPTSSFVEKKEDKPHLQLVCVDPFTGHLFVTTKTGLCYIF